MLHASTRKLIDRLSEMTELGKLDWTQTEDGNLSYATEGYSVSLTESPNEVVITSKDGKELERATAEEIAATENEDGASYVAVVAAMTQEASRIARGAEAAISSLLAGMEETPSDVEGDAATETPDEIADLQEDLGDETTAIAADSIETIPEPENLDPEADPAMDVSDEPALTEATDSVEDDAEVNDEPDVTIDAASDPEDGTDTDTMISADEDHGEDAPEQTDARAVSIETEPADVADNASMLDAASEDEALAETGDASDADDVELTASPDAPSDVMDDGESESDVSEAVARMASEVKEREDNGLETAAASAVGAVALAAGLTSLDSENEEDASDPIATEETADFAHEATDATDATGANEEFVSGDAETPPAYVPFGLDAERAQADEAPVEAETEPMFETSAATDVTTEPETASFEPETRPQEQVQADPEPQPEPAESTYEPVPEPAPESGPEPGPAFTFARDTADSDSVESEPTEDLITAEASPEEAEPADAAPFTFGQSAPEPEPISETSPEPAAPTTYSLSGIGAGFGLGALSAKTEASGIPSASTSVSETSEKVVIDATDDVLPKLEGNLNVALAETASAAVSNANAEAESTAPAEEDPDGESDILKPRTRFNPWD
ncbi:MAG: hypothetical protein AAF437_05115 [Pseudomonadota bacterium]